MATITSSSAVPVRNRLPLVVGALGTVYVVWGSTYLALWIMVEDMPPILASGLRAFTAAGLLAMVLVPRGGLGRLRVTPAHLAACALMGLLLPVLGQGLITVAEDGGAPSGLSALLIAAVPLWVACFSTLAGDRPPAKTVLGVSMGFAGTAILIAGHGVGGPVPTWTLLTVVAASVAWALGSWLQPHLRLPRDPIVVVVYEMLVGGAVMTTIGLGRGEHFDPTAYSAQSWTAWIFLVLIGSILAFGAYTWLLQTTAVSVVVTYAYVSPVVAVLLGWLILDEPVTVKTLLCAAVVIGGVVLVVGGERPTPQWLGTRVCRGRSMSPLTGQEFELSDYTHHLIEAANLKPGESVMDVGCGTGGPTVAAAHEAAPGTVVGVDYLASAVTTARSRVPRGLANLSFVVADAETHHPDVSPVDVIISRFGLMFFKDPAAAFANIANWLGAGGRLAALVWQRQDLNPWILETNRALTGVAAETMHVPFSLGDRDLLSAVLAQAGFIDVTMTTVREPVHLGATLPDAMDFVLGWSTYQEALAKLTPRAAEQARHMLASTLSRHVQDDGRVSLESAAWLVRARLARSQLGASDDLDREDR